MHQKNSLQGKSQNKGLTSTEISNKQTNGTPQGTSEGRTN